MDLSQRSADPSKICRLWLNEIRAENPELADEIHVFSSFFYKKLKNKK